MKTKTKKVIKKLFIIFVCLAVASISAVFVINQIVIRSTSKYIVSVEKCKEISDVDCILVLGCFAKPDGPSMMLEDRLKKGLELYKNGVSNRLLMSGDHGKTNYDEVNTMKKYCIENGAVANTVFLDHAGFSTYDSMYRARDVFKVKKLIIVTQGYHLYRAVYIARALGLDAYGVASDIEVFNAKNNIFNAVREPLARTKDFMMCIIKPKPVCLGEAIPISGSAELSDDKIYV
ncbi:MAG: ElyC/SanA/YdcF family protein [Oscillospiraceae bacterium]